MAWGSSLLRLPGRVGALLVAPRAALRRIDAEGGGLADAIALVAVGVVAFRLPELLQMALAVAGPTSGAFMRLVGLFATEAQEAAWVVLPAAVAITVLAGERRDASRDLELGAACYQVFFVVLGLFRAVDAVAGMKVLPSDTAWIAGAIATTGVLFQAVRVARARPLAPAIAETPAPDAGTAHATSPSAPGAASETSTPAAPAPRDPRSAAAARLAGAAIVAIALFAVGGNVVWSTRHLDALRPMRRGQSAPDFSLPRLDATPGTFGLEALRGKVVVLDFWATWCAPCVAMIPVLDEIHASWAPQGVAFVGINSDGGGTTVEEIRDFLIEHPFPYPVVRDDGRVGSLYKVEALPNLIVIGRDGRIRGSFIGYTGKATLAKALREAVDAPTDTGS